MTNFKTAAAIAAVLMSAGCMVSPPEVSRGQVIFMDNCAVCHGASGEGNGTAAGGLSPPPADLTRIAERNGGVFPEAEVMSAIDGYTRQGSGGAMPEFGEYLKDAEMVPVDLGDGTLTPTPEPLFAVSQYLESIQKP